MNISTIIVFIILILPLTCTGKAKRISPVMKVESAIFIERYVTYTHRGSRSQRKHGRLRVKGVELPDIFRLVMQGKRAYRFHQRKRMWGRDGYFPARPPGIRESEKTISKSDLRKGWYTGDMRLKGTPLYWIYVEWNSGKGFVDPGRIDEMQRALNIKRIPRMRMMMRLPGR